MEFNIEATEVIEPTSLDSWTLYWLSNAPIDVHSPQHIDEVIERVERYEAQRLAGIS